MPAVADILAPDPITQAQASRPVLLNHRTQSSVAIDGWAAALFGLPFIAAGLCTYFAAAFGDASRKHAPDWIITLIGTVFFGPGLALA